MVYTYNTRRLNAECNFLKEQQTTPQLPLSNTRPKHGYTIPICQWIRREVTGQNIRWEISHSFCGCTLISSVLTVSTGVASLTKKGPVMPSTTLSIHSNIRQILVYPDLTMLTKLVETNYTRWQLPLRSSQSKYVQSLQSALQTSYLAEI